ncbi:Uncharacterised protein [Mycobacterium tuberculosis]|nr:Uncharacterised protein [Mycobacterium tuberculosis]
MFDGDFKVVGHARRQTDRVREHRTHPVVLRLQPVKGLVRVPIQRRNAHQPDQFEAL